MSIGKVDFVYFWSKSSKGVKITLIGRWLENFSKKMNLRFCSDIVFIGADVLGWAFFTVMR